MSVLLALLTSSPSDAQTPVPDEDKTIPLDVLVNWQFHNNDGWRMLEKKNYKRAEERFNLAIESLKPYEKIAHRALARSYCDLARVLYHEGRYAEAEPLAKWALTVREADPKAKPDSRFQALYVLGMIHKAQKHYLEAEVCLKRALEVQESNLEPEHPGTTVTLDQLAGLYSDMSRFVDAAETLRKEARILEQERPDENLDLASVSDRYAAALEKLDRPADAAKWKARAAKIRETVAAKTKKSRIDARAKQFKTFE